MNDVVEFAIAETLSGRLLHIWRLWIEALPDNRVAASIVRVTERAMIGEMFHRFRQDFRIRRYRIGHVACRTRHRHVPQLTRDPGFDRRGFISRAEAA